MPTTATVVSRRRHGCSYDGPTGVELLTFVQDMVQDGLAFYVGGNASGQDNFLKLADAASRRP